MDKHFNGTNQNTSDNSGFVRKEKDDMAEMSTDLSSYKTRERENRRSKIAKDKEHRKRDDKFWERWSDFVMDYFE